MAIANSDKFQGVVCCCMDPKTSVQESIVKILNLNNLSTHEDLNYFDLKLENKYYQTTVHLFDCEAISDDELANKLFENCHAIILYGNGTTLSVECLDAKLKQLATVGGEPRLLLCGDIDEENEAYKTLQNWCIANSFDFLLTSEDDVSKQIIDSLSAYRWTNRTDNKRSSQNYDAKTQVAEDKPQLDGELMKKLVDFDNLLGKLSAYRDNPSMRGDPNDKNIEDIAEILSGLLGDDVDNFLESSDTDVKETIEES